MLGTLNAGLLCPLTTVLYEPEHGFYLLSRHFRRLQSATQDLFSDRDITLDIKALSDELWKVVDVLGVHVRQRVRVVITSDLQYNITSLALPNSVTRTLSIRLDTLPTRSPPHAIHKSTAREVYESARARAGADYASSGDSSSLPFDVLMWNDRGDVTETTIANFAVYLKGPELLSIVPGWDKGDGGLEQGSYVTPRADVGLIAGVMRAELLENGKLVEGNIGKTDVMRYAQHPDQYPMICFNAVRGVYNVRLDVSPISNFPSYNNPRLQPADTTSSKSDKTKLPIALSLDLHTIPSNTAPTTPNTTPGLTPLSSTRPSSASSFHSTPKYNLDPSNSLPNLVQSFPRSPFIWRRGVIIDCYDSYTNNLLQLFDQDDSTIDAGFSSMLNAYVTVLRADQLSWPEFETQILPHIDFVVLSPGPGSPHVSSDIGVGGDLLLSMARDRLAIHPIPVLGICLGHQALAALFGGKVVPAHELVHGRTVPVKHDGTGLFDGLSADQPLHMVRYNSLTVDAAALPTELEVIAINPNDNEIMALKHKTLPLYGVQFHPESICSRRSRTGVDAGKQILRNFMNITENFWLAHGRPDRLPLPQIVRRHSVLEFLAMDCLTRAPFSPVTPKQSPFRVVKHDLGPFVPAFARTRPELVFEATSYSSNNPFFWLDSAAAAPGDTFARFSYMGLASPNHCISYELATHVISCGEQNRKHLGEVDSFWNWMDRVQSGLAGQVDIGDAEGGLQCGFVGYFGYEMKAGALPGYTSIPIKHQSADLAPDAQFMFVDRLLVHDHWNNSWSAVGLVRRDDDVSTWTTFEQELGVQVGMSSLEFTSWLDIVTRELGSLQVSVAAVPLAPDPDPLPVRFSYNSTPHAYKSAIQACQSHIADGNSYELCLTGQYTAPASNVPLDYLSVYKHFRAHNPASHAAFVQFPKTRTTIMSCSPELFIRFDGENGRQAIMKPIKGTLKRTKCRCGGLCKLPACGPRKAECGAARLKKDEERIRTFVEDPKETAENLMIADLIRANLLEFCDPSSVDVTKLFALETYENVYSLVSTITGTIPPSVGPVEGMRRCFPPGSMTGAPKLRSVQLLDTLETSRRGIYSGCLGFLSLDNRAVFSVVIRTLIAHGDELSYGAGGAITCLSDVDGEWREVVLKAQSVLNKRVSPADK